MPHVVTRRLLEATTWPGRAGAAREALETAGKRLVAEIMLPRVCASLARSENVPAVVSYVDGCYKIQLRTREQHTPCIPGSDELGSRSVQMLDEGCANIEMYTYDIDAFADEMIGLVEQPVLG